MLTQQGLLNEQEGSLKLKLLNIEVPDFSQTPLFRKDERRVREYFWKVVRLHVLVPVKVSIPAVALWYFLMYREDLRPAQETAEVIMAAWIPTFGVLYSLVAAILFGLAVNKYSCMRAAIEAFEFHEFMKWRKPAVSPAFHALMSVLAVGVVFGYAYQPYEHWYEGATLVGGSAHVFALFYFVIREIDNPFQGIWVIRSIPAEWLSVDPKRYREKLAVSRREVWAVFLETEEGVQEVPNATA